MKTVKGNLIHMALLGDFDVIVHGCNCFNTMGAGIAKQIKRNFPAAYQADLATIKGDKSKLGTITYTKINGLYVVNAYTQYNYAYGKHLTDYDAIQKAFRKVYETFQYKRIGYPAIGAGLAGGDWNKIATIIDQELSGTDHTFVSFK